MILKEKKISSIKTWEIIIEGIRVIIKKCFKPQDSVVPSIVPNKNPAQKELLKCWECGEPQYFKGCLARKQKLNVHSI